VQLIHLYTDKHKHKYTQKNIHTTDCSQEKTNKKKVNRRNRLNFWF